MQQRISWKDLPKNTRTAIQARTGPIEQASTVSEGTNSALATVLHTSTGRVFIKGMPTDHPSVATQQREATINPHVRTLAPALLWHISDAAGWNVLGFEHIEGRHPDYSPGSTDLPIVADVMQTLSALSCPDVPVKDAGTRWAPYLDQPTAIELFTGNTLLHTDYNPENILITPDGTARLIDWAWPTRGAGWIDPCCLLIRLIAAGHTAYQAETWVQRIPAWHTALASTLDMFSFASARLWQEIADNDPRPWKQRMATAAREWADARMMPVRNGEPSHSPETSSSGGNAGGSNGVPGEVSPAPRPPLPPPEQHQHTPGEARPVIPEHEQNPLKTGLAHDPPTLPRPRPRCPNAVTRSDPV